MGWYDISGEIEISQLNFPSWDANILEMLSTAFLPNQNNMKITPNNGHQNFLDVTY